MPVYSTPAVALALSALRTRVRKKCNDPSTNVQNQRHTNAEIDIDIDNMIAKMYAEWTKKSRGAHLGSVTLAMTASAVPTALPAGLEANALYRVEDYSDASNPVVLDPLSPQDIDRSNSVEGWTLMGNAIALRPQPSTATTLRIWYLRDFTRLSLGGDAAQHDLPINHEELIVQGASKRLMILDGEWTPDHQQHYDDLWKDFVEARRHKGRQYVQSVRKFR